MALAAPRPVRGYADGEGSVAVPFPQQAQPRDGGNGAMVSKTRPWRLPSVLQKIPRELEMESERKQRELVVAWRRRKEMEWVGKRRRLGEGEEGGEERAGACSSCSPLLLARKGGDAGVTVMKRRGPRPVGWSWPAGRRWDFGLPPQRAMFLF